MILKTNEVVSSLRLLVYIRDPEQNEMIVAKVEVLSGFATFGVLNIKALGRN